MVQHWQAHYGTPGRRRYHNQAWADHMKLLGLLPYNVHHPEKETGDTCSHRIQPGGRFDVACQRLLTAGFAIRWEAGGRTAVISAGSRSKVAYVCSGCNARVWGKHGLRLVCGDCGQPLEGSAGDDGGNLSYSVKPPICPPPYLQVY